MQINDLKKKCEELSEIKARKSELEKQKTELNEVQDLLEKQIEAALEEHELDRFDFGAGLVSKAVKVNVSIVDKVKLFEYLKQTNEFEGLASVNVRTLQSVVKEKIEAQGGEWIEIPGLEITPYVDIMLRNSK